MENSINTSVNENEAVEETTAQEDVKTYTQEELALIQSEADKRVKKIKMDEEMNACELLKEVAEENQTRKILEILNNCKDLEEAKEKIKALLNK